MTHTTSKDTIGRIFIGSPLKPAAGRWVELPTDRENLEEIIEQIRDGHNVEEVIVTDTEGLCNYFVRDGATPWGANQKAEKIAEQWDLEAAAIYYSLGSDPDLEHFEDAYQGHFEGGRGYSSPLAEFALEFAIDTGMTTDEDCRYFDEDALARDFDCSGYYEENGHIFRPV